MARYAIIENGKVANLVEALAAFAASKGWVPAGAGAVMGAGYAGGTFTPPPPMVPDAVPKLNGKLAMVRAGWFSDIKAFLDAIPGTEGDEARVYFADTETMRRDHKMVLNISAALGKTPAEVDAMFILAATLEV